MSREQYATRGFLHDVRCVRNGQIVWQEPRINLIPAAAMDFLAQAPFGGATAIPNIYTGLFDRNYVPHSAAVSADLPLVIGEFLGYEGAQRPEWVRSYAAGTHTNELSPVEYTVTVSGERVLYGGFLSSSSAKGSNNGLLVSIARFNNPRTVQAGDRLEHRITLAFVSVG